jgi:hypothetical protein
MHEQPGLDRQRHSRMKNKGCNHNHTSTQTSWVSYMDPFAPFHAIYLNLFSVCIWEKQYKGKTTYYFSSEKQKETTFKSRDEMNQGKHGKTLGNCWFRYYKHGQNAWQFGETQASCSHLCIISGFVHPKMEPTQVVIS